MYVVGLSLYFFMANSNRGCIDCYFKKGHMLPTLVFPNNSVGKESACNAGDSGSIPGSGRSTGEGRGYPLHYPTPLSSLIKLKLKPKQIQSD